MVLRKRREIRISEGTRKQNPINHFRSFIPPKIEWLKCYQRDGKEIEIDAVFCARESIFYGHVTFFENWVYRISEAIGHFDSQVLYFHQKEVFFFQKGSFVRCGRSFWKCGCSFLWSEGFFFKKAWTWGCKVFSGDTSWLNIPDTETNVTTERKSYNTYFPLFFSCLRKLRAVKSGPSWLQPGG